MWCLNSMVLQLIVPAIINLLNTCQRALGYIETRTEEQSGLL